MDISSLKNLSNYRMSLVDFMNNGKSSYFDSVSQGLLDSVAARYGAAAQASEDSATGDKVTLSEEAKALLAATGDNNANLTGVQKAAQNLLIGFFDQSGIDTSKLSNEALDLIEGLQGVIAGSGATARDLTTDSLEMRHGENGKKVYTLLGNGTRLRLAVEYAEDKTTPVKLSITDITGAKVETASITITDDEGTMRLNIDRAQREYRNGHMVNSGEIDPLSVKLYGA